MVTTFLLIGLGCFFFMLGHSTLLFFKGKDVNAMSLMDAILPWPTKGKFISLIC